MRQEGHYSMYHRVKKVIKLTHFLQGFLPLLFLRGCLLPNSVNLSQQKPVHLLSLYSCDFEHCLLQCHSYTPCQTNKPQQFKQTLFHGVMTPSLKSVGPGFLTDVG